MEGGLRWHRSKDRARRSASRCPRSTAKRSWYRVGAMSILPLPSEGAHRHHPAPAGKVSACASAAPLSPALRAARQVGIDCAIVMSRRGYKRSPVCTSRTGWLFYLSRTRPRVRRPASVLCWPCGRCPLEVAVASQTPAPLLRLLRAVPAPAARPVPPSRKLLYVYVYGL